MCAITSGICKVLLEVLFVAGEEERVGVVGEEETKVECVGCGFVDLDWEGSGFFLGVVCHFMMDW